MLPSLSKNANQRGKLLLCVFLMLLYYCMLFQLDIRLSPRDHLQVTYSKDKAVVVRVYAENPGKKRSSSIQQHHHHHHLHYHVHHTFRQEVVHGPASNGYDRRAGLLMYSHQLRQSARELSSSIPLLSKSANNNLQPAPTKVPLTF